jgi:hypothetical protein
VAHTTIPRPAPFKPWVAALLVLVAVAIAVLLATSLSATTVTTAPTPTDTGAATSDAPATITPCRLPSTIVQAEALDPESCATRREGTRVDGPR